jgi:hypothetical protein
MMSHGARIVTISPRDQNLLRVVLDEAIKAAERQGVDDTQSGNLRDLKERLGL